MDVLGVQVLADLYGCDVALLDDPHIIEQLLIEAAQRCGATIVSSCFHRFSPHGVSGVVVIAESHLAVHTWPEHRFVALDLFTCGESLRPDDCFRFLKEALRCETSTLQRIPRGRPMRCPPTGEAPAQPSDTVES
ncbi:MAG: adenosylmethionine decarboxylase [Myxococcales bacterium]|nr:adenosylmethionine decarboxylase [Myxococcales bacterium]